MIELLYGNRQQFRLRHSDINLLGKTDASLPVEGASYRLNDGAPVPFYVEPEPKPGGRPYPWGTKTPSVLRLRDRPGHFNIEIPTDCLDLQVGRNAIAIHIRAKSGEQEELDAEFCWDPSPLPLPLDLTDLSGYRSIQDVAQLVNGEFGLDPQRNVIYSRTPVGADVLLLLGVAVHDCETPRCGFMPRRGAAQAAPL